MEGKIFPLLCCLVAFLNPGILAFQSLTSGAKLYPKNVFQSGINPNFSPTKQSSRPGSSCRQVHHHGSEMKMSVDTIDASYNLAIGCFGLGLTCGVLEDLKGPTAKFFGGAAIAFTVFAAFLTFQTTTLRFTFDDTSFSLVKTNGNSIGENVVVGGENSWAYSSFKNWDFLPSEDFPILVYFREDQTPEAVREEVPIKVDDLDGQVHFFPAIANTQQLKENFISHGCAKATK